jgi:hypothetical protein
MMMWKVANKSISTACSVFVFFLRADKKEKSNLSFANTEKKPLKSKSKVCASNPKKSKKCQNPNFLTSNSLVKQKPSSLQLFLFGSLTIPQSVVKNVSRNSPSLCAVTTAVIVEEFSALIVLRIESLSLTALLVLQLLLRRLAHQASQAPLNSYLVQQFQMKSSVSATTAGSLSKCIKNKNMIAQTKRDECRCALKTKAS